VFVARKKKGKKNQTAAKFAFCLLQEMNKKSFRLFFYSLSLSLSLSLFFSTFLEREERKKGTRGGIVHTHIHTLTLTQTDRLSSSNSSSSAGNNSDKNTIR
jgi:hypothetical protein